MPTVLEAAISDGEPCPYVANQPLTHEGRQAWDVLLRCSGQLELVNGSVVGLDLDVALASGRD